MKYQVLKNDKIIAESDDLEIAVSIYKTTLLSLQKEAENDAVSEYLTCSCEVRFLEEKKFMKFTLQYDDLK